MEEVKNEQINETQGMSWSETVLTPDLPLIALVDFLNVLNQRLCNLENLIAIEDKDGQHRSIAEIYKNNRIEAATANEEKQGE